MTNLFSIFDPSTSLMNMKLNWLISMLSLMIMSSPFWLMNNRHMIMWKNMTMKMYMEFKTIMDKNMMTIMFMSLLPMIMINNTLGLFPHLFTSTSHLSMTLTLALPMWLSYMLYGWLKNTNHMFTHLTPLGTPNALMPFMVCIETISNMIRPGTLAVRLSANMIAGHLILSLLGNTILKMDINMMWMMLLIQMLLLTLEIAVAMIQGYVFTVLSILYSKEVN
nr:ATP synthase F0 subunit 6 [Carausius sp.]